MGGAIALCIALARPDLLSGLVLVGTGARLRVSPEILEGLRTSPAETQGLVARAQFTERADPAMILRTIKDLAGTPAERTLADFRACDAYDVRDRIGSIDLPALVLVGSEDRMTPVKSAAFLAERMPRATLTVIDGVGHAIMIEESDRVSNEIAAFLDALRPAEPGEPETR
jgi:pimeloyl-ACP methyl ester carboxylesterase